MAQKIKIKRSDTTATPASLNDGEIAYSFQSHNFFIGDGVDVFKIGGKTDVDKLANIEANADVTDAVNVDSAGAVMESDYDANTILKADSDNTPAALNVPEGRMLGRLSGDVIAALTAVQIRTLLNVEDGAAADQVWGEIGGTLANQTDLQNELDLKAPINNPTFTGAVTLPGSPTLDLQAATKQYVDQVAQGLDAKDSVKTATTVNITLSGEQTVDGIALTTGDRILVKNQTDASENGIYIVATGAWARSSDADAWGELISAFVFVEEGTNNADTGWTCTVDAGGTLETTDVTWVQFSGAGSYSADGLGLELSGSEFSLELDGSTLSKSGTGLKVATGGIADNEVNASAAITLSKLAALTANRALLSDVSGVVSVSAVTNTELGYLSGVTSAIQTQLDSKIGDITGEVLNDLSDVSVGTPGAGQDGHIVYWNNTGGAFQIKAPIFLDNTDTPSSFSGHGGKLVAVNSGASALEFVDEIDGGSF